MKAQIQVELEKLLPQMKKVSTMISAAEEDWPNYYDRNQPDDMYLRIMFYQIQGKLDDARRYIRQATAHVSSEGTIHKRPDGRYGNERIYFSSGSNIEFLFDDSSEESRWIYSHVEHNGDDYYIVAKPELPMSGLWVRVKQLPMWD